ncbi:MAG TPA: ATP synthase F0 subunit B [Erysipelotrichaceae bacterium]|nr:ATP synthase F0 subunit B [Erysipelotrichaceae bacterium]
MLDIDIAGKLFPDIKTMIVQLAATGVLFYAFYRYLWQPVLTYLEKRAAYEQNLIEQAKQKFQEAETSKEEAHAQLKHASMEANKIIERGQNEGKRIKEGLVADGRKEAELKLQSARRQLDYERSQMKQSIHREIVDVALLATSKLIEDKLDESADRLVIEQFVKDVVN